ncbi:alpha/beta hydrolase [Limnohabitans sp.]|uniref:alpha/beta hydrolase n=1 Tax=Limnohabitans sp. TaxID=1907725 RepID=UPI00286EF2C6|nr:alpha/beta hydrolase [Limnohabitans sp.]
MTVRDGAWYDRMYNNRALVPAYATHFAHWRQASSHARVTQRSFQNVAYGLGLNETVDIFPSDSAQDKAPVVVFIHGGFWRSLDKADHSFIAPAFTAHGAHVVVPNYALCPVVTISDIVLQMVKCVAWVWRNIHRFGGDPSRITLIGHSAGGQIVAMLLACDWPRYAHDLPAHMVSKALSISGLYELASIRATPYLQDSLRLTAQDAVRNSPAWMPAPKLGTLYSVVGGIESEEFLRHNALIQQAWGQTRVPVAEALAGLQHFSIVEALTQPNHRLHTLALELLQK